MIKLLVSTYRRHNQGKEKKSKSGDMGIGYIGKEECVSIRPST